jgi:predicted ATP-binding protein involved in virulence
MKISALRAEPFAPFGEFEIEFPHLAEEESPNLAEVHVFTGPNGSGKTRLLACLAAGLGSWKELEKREIFRYSTKLDMKFRGVGNYSDSGLFSALDRIIDEAKEEELVAMTFCPRAYLEHAPVKANAEIRIPSKDAALSFSRSGDDSHRLLQGLFTMELQAATESRQSQTGRYSRMIKYIEMAIEEVTGRKFSFASTVHPKPEFLVRWGDAPETFSITTLPDGLRSILGWLVQGVVWMDIFFSEAADPFEQPVILLVDEPETHLHPEWQWRVMPMMQRLFPKAQIFVATHSPFVVSSLNENAWIHRLRVGEGGAVTVEEPRMVEQGDSYVTALSSVLEVSDWYDPENRKLLAEFRTLLSAALKGGEDEEHSMRNLAQKIAGRGMELEQVVSAELRQYERQKLQLAEFKRIQA